MDNAKLDAAARNANMLSVALYSSGGKDTYLSITNRADVTLVASDRADVFGWCLDARGDGVSRVLVENSSLTARCGDGTGYSRKHGYGIYSQSGSQSAIPRIDIINSNVEVSGNAAAIYAVNQGDAAPCLSIDGGSVVTTPPEAPCEKLWETDSSSVLPGRPLSRMLGPPTRLPAVW